MDVFERIRASADRLNAASDRCSGVLRAAEQRLRDMHVGVEAGTDLDPACGYNRLLYCRTQSGWRLAVKAGDAGPVPVLEVSRRARLEAAPKLPALLVQVAAAVHAQADRAGETADSLPVFPQDAPDAAG